MIAKIADDYARSFAARPRRCPPFAAATFPDGMAVRVPSIAAALYIIPAGSDARRRGIGTSRRAEADVAFSGPTHTLYTTAPQPGCSRQAASFKDAIVSASERWGRVGARMRCTARLRTGRLRPSWRACGRCTTPGTVSKLVSVGERRASRRAHRGAFRRVVACAWKCRALPGPVRFPRH